MADDNKQFPLWMVAAASLLGGGTLGVGGNTFLSNTDQALTQRIESLENQIRNMQETDSNIWKTKASKEYVNLKIQALCK